MCPHTKFSLGGKEISVPLNYSFGYLLGPGKPWDHVHVKCMQLVVWGTDVEYVYKLRVTCHPISNHIIEGLRSGGLTQNHAGNCMKYTNMHTLPVYALNFEILKFFSSS